MDRFGQRMMQAGECLPTVARTGFKADALRFQQGHACAAFGELQRGGGSRKAAANNDHIGFGWTFGDKNRYEIGYRLQHLSNAGLSDPNDGINFHQIRFGYNY